MAAFFGALQNRDTSTGERGSGRDRDGGGGADGDGQSIALIQFNS